MPKGPSWSPPGRAIIAGADRRTGTDGSEWRSRISTDALLAGRPRETTDDRALVAAVLDGDRDAFRAIVDREHRALVRACHRVLGDLHEAEDVVQEAFVTAYRSLGGWRGDGSLGAWLARIAVRLAVRRAAQRKTVTWIEPDADGAGMPTAPASADPAIAALRSERTASIRAAVAALDEPYRETVALRFFAERSLAEIASETGRPLGTVKTHLHRGLLRLRDRLEAGGVDR
jgi:RNA polymerase sigma-70 factor (ECF subfamily)